jgi:hypothetical protein
VREISAQGQNKGCRGVEESPHPQLIAGRSFRPFHFVRGHLDNCEPSKRADNPTCGHVASRFQDATASVDDEYVDRKSHEKRVHHVRRRNDQRLPGSQRVTPQEPTIPRCGIQSRLKSCGDVLSGSLVEQPERTFAAAKQRLQKVRFQKNNLRWTS